MRYARNSVNYQARMPHVLRREMFIPRPVEEVFAFFSRAENLQELTPPWLNFRILTPPPIEMRQGASIAYQLRVHCIRLNWLTEIAVWNPPVEFVDVQVRGPYKLWRHTHHFDPEDGGTRMVDTVEYEVPFGALGRLIQRLQVSRDLSRIFDYRADRIRSLLS
jgi:ligand-binding SRPBCC domain-containing protein